MPANLNDLKSIFNRPKKGSSRDNASSATNNAAIKAALEQTYQLKNENWYSAKPYGFRVNTRDNKSITMFLPINPSNLRITTNFATNLIPTLYGTIEEHSEVRYYDITISGTTGMAPKFVDPISGSDDTAAFNSAAGNGRLSFAASDSFNISAGGFFQKTVDLINRTLQKATDLYEGKKPKPGVFSEKSGYVAFHNLYRVLLEYKKDVSGVNGSQPRERHPLTFFNYKDNNQYDVVVRSFTLTRSADNPMLYNYEIVLRGYNMQTVGGKGIGDDLAQRQKNLGLDGIDSSSILGDIKSIASQAKSILGSAVSGINILGR